MLADTESEKTKWVVALSELHRILKKNNLPNTTVGKIISRQVANSEKMYENPVILFFCFADF